MQFVLIPAGEFIMGTAKTEMDVMLNEDRSYYGLDEEHGPNECPAHRVFISRAFFLGMHEVTQGEFERVMGSNPSKHSPGRGDKSRNPVDSVSDRDAEDFCKALSSSPAEEETGRSYRLPTEAEWEYAYRAGSPEGRDYIVHGGGLLEYGWSGAGGPEQVSSAGTTFVGSFHPNGFGLYDMRGNVWEWCSDWYDPEFYRMSPSTDPGGPGVNLALGIKRNGVTFKEKVIRGGAYNSVEEICRPAFRGHKTARSTDGVPTGLRVVCVVPETPEEPPAVMDPTGGRVASPPKPTLRPE